MIILQDPLVRLRPGPLFEPSECAAGNRDGDIHLFHRSQYATVDLRSASAQMESVDVNAQVSGCCFDRGSQRRNSSTEAIALTRPKTDADRQRTDVFRTVSRQRRQIWDSSSGGEWGVGQGVRIGWSGRQWINIFASVFAVRESRGYTIESGMALRRSRSAVMSFIAVSFRRIQATTSGEGLTERGQTYCDLAGTSTVIVSLWATDMYLETISC
ncbi:hypothetical protein DFH09DRAFT_1316524 [Mycena vulgaris]|nr:hypothetical protein DFH09DRAFT_1316524 [Mycena vulgaris]